LAAGTHTAIITVSSPEASPTSRAINAVLKISNEDSHPIGYLDTPAQGATVRGSISISGWALDDVEVSRVEIMRAPAPEDKPESISPDGLVFIGDALFVEGARPDVAQRYPDAPLCLRAGWGYMMLTYGLPNRGNGTFTLYAVATDNAGHKTVLGRKTIVSDNASSRNPFGTIDLPEQGGTVSGASYYSFGWALTPTPKTIPKDGSTIWVWIDGVKLGHPVYNQFRSDVANAYSEYNNAQGAVGYYVLDTTKYDNGIHTIGWSVADDQGQEEGIGSRYFSVDNFGAENASTAAFDPILPDATFYAGDIGISIREIKKGFGLRPAAGGAGDDSGSQEIVVGESEPLNIILDGRGPQGLKFRGWEGDADERRSLPIGSTLDSREGVFSWIPTPGFIGTYCLNFVAESGSMKSDPVRIRVTVMPRY